MTEKTLRYEIGCYGDGALGHMHTRERCASVLQDCTAAVKATYPNDIVVDLLDDMSVDASEELEACEWLNIYAKHPDATWDWSDGDFGLWPNEED